MTFDPLAYVDESREGSEQVSIGPDINPDYQGLVDDERRRIARSVLDGHAVNVEGGDAVKRDDGTYINMDRQYQDTVGKNYSSSHPDHWSNQLTLVDDCFSEVMNEIRDPKVFSHEEKSMPT